MIPTRKSPMPRVDKGDPFLLIAYRANPPVNSHVGLGINALHTAKVLRANGIRTQPYPVWATSDIKQLLDTHTNEVTHILIEAPWVSDGEMRPLTQAYPHIHFICRCHSQIGFLQVEAGAIAMLRAYGLWQQSTLNFSLASNNETFCQYWGRVYNQNCLYLPNLYFLGDRNHHGLGQRDMPVLRISSWGALRLLKNHTTAAAAALLAARRLGKNLEFYVNTNREEHGKGVRVALLNMFSSLPWAKIVEIPWDDWAIFRQHVAHMHLCLQVSMTETFNLCTADAAAEGVASVVSDAIEWVPKHWQANVDDASDIARVGCNLLADPTAGKEGLDSLTKYVANGVRIWKDWLL